MGVLVVPLTGATWTTPGMAAPQPSPFKANKVTATSHITADKTPSSRLAQTDPSLLGRTDQLMIGRVLSDEFFANRDWPVASSVAILMLVLLVGPIMVFQRFQNRELESRK